MKIVIDVLTLGVSIVTLLYLVKYVRATNTIAKQSIRQVEASFRPAIVCIPAYAVTNNPKLRNIGKGAAIDVHWSLDNLHGTIPYLEPANEDYELCFGGMKPLFETKSPVVISYKSISGLTYTSRCTYEPERDEFSTAFSE